MLARLSLMCLNVLWYGLEMFGQGMLTDGEESSVPLNSLPQPVSYRYFTFIIFWPF
jgi:hypothetical protein